MKIAQPYDERITRYQCSAPAADALGEYRALGVRAAPCAQHPVSVYRTPPIKPVHQCALVKVTNDGWYSVVVDRE